MGVVKILCYDHMVIDTEKMTLLCICIIMYCSGYLSVACCSSFNKIMSMMQLEFHTITAISISIVMYFNVNSLILQHPLSASLVALMLVIVLSGLDSENTQSVLMMCTFSDSLTCCT